MYPNLGEVARGEGLRWLILHEVTHLAQFRSAPWIPEEIVEGGRRVLALDDRGWLREAAQRLRSRLPEIIRTVRDALEGRTDRTTGSLLLEILPDEQRRVVEHLHALVTLLEGHATYVTDRVAGRIIPDYETFQRRIREARRRPPLVRVVEALVGIDLKRQQYVLGRSFCEAVWAEGGAEALAPAWRSPEGAPTLSELRDPASWLERTA